MIKGILKLFTKGFEKEVLKEQTIKPIDWKKVDQAFNVIRNSKLTSCICEF